MSQVDIVQWAGSQYGFYVDRHYIGGRWVLQPGPIRLADYHARILRHIFTPDESGRWPYDTVAGAEPAKSGKSCHCRASGLNTWPFTAIEQHIVMASQQARSSRNPYV